MKNVDYIGKLHFWFLVIHIEFINPLQPSISNNSSNNVKEQVVCGVAAANQGMYQEVFP